MLQYVSSFVSIVVREALQALSFVFVIFIIILILINMLLSVSWWFRLPWYLIEVKLRCSGNLMYQSQILASWQHYKAKFLTISKHTFLTLLFTCQQSSSLPLLTHLIRSGQNSRVPLIDLTHVSVLVCYLLDTVLWRKLSAQVWTFLIFLRMKSWVL